MEYGKTKEREERKIAHEEESFGKAFLLRVCTDPAQKAVLRGSSLHKAQLPHYCRVQAGMDFL